MFRLNVNSNEQNCVQREERAAEGICAPGAITSASFKREVRMCGRTPTFKIVPISVHHYYKINS